VRQLYFVRHGQSQANVDRVYAGQLDTPLTLLGREQAVIAGEAARELSIDHIISSPLSRTRDTALIIAETIDYPKDSIEYLDLLVEQGYGSAVGLSWDEDISGYDDIETMESLAERAHMAYEYLKTLPQDVVLVVGHGTFWQKLYTTIHPDTVVSSKDEPANAQIVQLI
jgi:probable phosphoglycerate mutase